LGTVHHHESAKSLLHASFDPQEENPSYLLGAHLMLIYETVDQRLNIILLFSGDVSGKVYPVPTYDIALSSKPIPLNLLVEKN
jgi:hypothetical protein